jgi:hypothetical protein
MLLCASLATIPTAVGLGCAHGSSDRRADLGERLAWATARGQEIHRHDMLGWWATDILLDELDSERLDPAHLDQMRGWVVEADGQFGGEVHFLVERGGELRRALTVRCDGSGPHGCALEVLAPTALSEAQAARVRALMTARAHPAFEPTSPNYNHVVLPAEDSRWWVYFIAATTEPELLMLGRHYRFLVSADGERVLESRAFSKTAIVIDPRTKPDGDGELTGVVVSHLLDDIPTEMHVWAALNYGIAIGVAAADRSLWTVDAYGAITPVDP